MFAILSLLCIVTLSVVVTRIATLALTLTGLSRESARFQARSAFTGVGFTTSESERVVQHPVRRRILLTLMLVGSAGVVTVLASLLLAFLDGESGVALWIRGVTLVGGLTLLVFIANSSAVDRWLTDVILGALKRFTDLDVQDYAGLLRLAGDYTISEVHVSADGDWLADRTLVSLKLPEEGVLCLGIQRDGDTYLGAPRGSTRVLPGDTLVLYGRAGTLRDIASRAKGFAGWVRHRESAEEHRDQEADPGASTDPTSEGHGEHRASTTAAALVCALLLGACGDPAPAAPNVGTEPRAGCEVTTRVLPDRWIQLARVAGEDDCATPQRIAAIREMRGAGPHANLVLPVLERLATDGPEPLRAEAILARDALLEGLPPAPGDG